MESRNELSCARHALDNAMYALVANHCGSSGPFTLMDPSLSAPVHGRSQVDLDQLPSVRNRQGFLQPPPPSHREKDARHRQVVGGGRVAARPPRLYGFSSSQS
ncbi:MAG TPA: hypothetical protein VF898_06700 [Chloroflexota bacterium]